MRRILIAATLATAILVTTGCASAPPPVSDKVQQAYNENLKKQTASATPTPARATVSVLSDSHAYNAGSWFRQTVEAGTVPGVALGAFASQPGASSTVIAGKLDEATAQKGVVIVQAGTNDLMSAVTPADTATNIEALIRGVKDRGSKPVLALIPPSNTRGRLVLETNALLKQYAAENKVGLLDVTSSVIDTDGSWKAGLSGDGVHANGGGCKLMADAATQQLPALVR